MNKGVVRELDVGREAMLTACRSLTDGDGPEQVAPAILDVLRSPQSKGAEMATVETEKRSPVKIVREIFDTILNQRNADTLRRYLVEVAPDEVLDLPTGTCRGPEEVAGYFAEVFAALPDFHMEPERIAGEGETVFVKWRLTGTFNGRPWQGIGPSGDQIELTGIDCFIFRDGRIVHNTVVFDQMAFARQIGMLPAQESIGERAMKTAFNTRTRLKQGLHALRARRF